MNGPADNTPACPVCGRGFHVNGCTKERCGNSYVVNLPDGRDVAFRSREEAEKFAASEQASHDDLEGRRIAKELARIMPAKTPYGAAVLGEVAQMIFLLREWVRLLPTGAIADRTIALLERLEAAKR